MDPGVCQLHFNDWPTMKKFILLFFSFLLLSQSQTISAVKYRGFVEASLGYAMTPFHENDHNEDVPLNRMMFDFTTTHGVQINKVFVGAGTGFLLPDLYCMAASIPFYVAGRYDFWGKGGINPFVALKIGYVWRIPGTETMGSDLYYEDKEYVEGGLTCKYENYLYEGNIGDGFYMQPTVGVRFRMGKNTGFNLGLSCNIFNLKTMKEGNTYLYIYHPDSDGYQLIDTTDYFVPAGKNKLGAVLSLNIGFDF